MRLLRSVRIEAYRLRVAGGAGGRRFVGQQSVLVQQMRERQSAHAAARAEEEFTARPECLCALHCHLHRLSCRSLATKARKHEMTKMFSCFRVFVAIQGR